MRNICFVIIAAILLSSAALADGISDANAGMDALKADNNAKAIAMFTRAITLGQLGHDDLELAYVKRAQAYIDESNNKQALADLERAAKLLPNDPDIAALRPWAQVPNGVSPPRPITETHTLPPYPEESQRLGEQGKTVLLVLVGKDGRVVDTRIAQSSGSDRLDAAAMDHVKAGWAWEEPILNKRPSETIMQVVVNWQLNGDLPPAQPKPAILGAASNDSQSVDGGAPAQPSNFSSITMGETSGQSDSPQQTSALSPMTNEEQTNEALRLASMCAHFVTEGPPPVTNRESANYLRCLSENISPRAPQATKKMYFQKAQKAAAAAAANPNAPSSDDD